MDFKRLPYKYDSKGEIMIFKLLVTEESLSLQRKLFKNTRFVKQSTKTVSIRKSGYNHENNKKIKIK